MKKLIVLLLLIPLSVMWLEPISRIYMQGWESPTRIVYEVPQWQLDIYRKEWITLTEFLTLSAIKNIECADEFGRCYGWSVWPFQVNYIHTWLRERSNKYLDSWHYEQLFVEQMWFIQSRFNLTRNCDVNNNKIKQMCFAKIHNGNNDMTCNGREWKHCFAELFWKVREDLKKFYIDKY